MTVPPKITADAWVTAVNRGETMHGYEDWKKEQLQAPYEAEEPEPVIREYGLRIWATFRCVAETTVEATSYDQAVKMAKELQLTGPVLDFSFDIAEGNDPEGDETIHVFGPDDEDVDNDDEWSGEGLEVDRRAEGEPFSWDACRLVKNLAKLDGLPRDPECMQQLDALVAEAKSLCTKDG